MVVLLLIVNMGISLCYGETFHDNFASSKLNEKWIVVKSKEATTNDNIFIQSNQLIMATGKQGVGFWNATTINLRYRELLKNDSFELNFKVNLTDFESGFRAGPGGELYVDFYVPQYMEIWTLIFQWGVPKNGLPPNPEKKAAMSFMSYNHDENWLDVNSNVFSYVGFGKDYYCLPTNKWLNVKIKNEKGYSIVSIDDGKKHYSFVSPQKGKRIKKFLHSNNIPAGYLQFRLNKARSHVSCMLDDISLDYDTGDSDAVRNFVDNKKKELDAAFLEDKNAVDLSAAQGLTIGGDMGFGFNALSKIFYNEELFGNPARMVPLGNYKYMLNVLAKEQLGNTFISTRVDADKTSQFLQDIQYIGAEAGFWTSTQDYNQLIKNVDEKHIAFAEEGGEWSSYLSRGTEIHGDSMQDSRAHYLKRLEVQVHKELNRDIPVEKITHEETSAIINDFFRFGFKQMTYEKVWWNYAPVFMSLMRPASIDSGVNKWGVWHAYCQYNIMNPELNGNDAWAPNLKSKLNWFRLALLYGYIGGGEYFYTENGLSSFWAVMGNTWLYGLYDYHTRTLRNIQKNFYKFAQRDKRPAGFPDRSLAFIKGENDSWRGDFLVYEAWNGSKRHCWNNEKYPYDTPEVSWRSLLNFMPIKGNATNDMDVFNGSVYGLLDILDSSVKQDVYNEYKELVMVGWNNMDKAMYDKLVEYVRQGGKLSIGIPQFIKNEKGDREKAISLSYSQEDLYNKGDYRDLLGVQIQGKGDAITEIKGQGHSYKVSGIYGSKVSIIDKKNMEILYSDQNGRPIMVRRHLGKGSVEMLLLWNYVGDVGLSDFVQDYMQSKANGLQDQMPIYVTERGKQEPGELSKSIAVSVYSDAGVVYILSVDDKETHKIDIHFRDGGKKQYKIKPAELLRIDLKTQQITEYNI